MDGPPCARWRADSTLRVTATCGVRSRSRCRGLGVASCAAFRIDGSRNGSQGRLLAPGTPLLGSYRRELGTSWRDRRLQTSCAVLSATSAAHLVACLPAVRFANRRHDAAVRGSRIRAMSAATRCGGRAHV